MGGRRAPEGKPPFLCSICDSPQGSLVAAPEGLLQSLQSTSHQLLYCKLPDMWRNNDPPLQALDHHMLSFDLVSAGTRARGTTLEGLKALLQPPLHIVCGFRQAWLSLCHRQDRA